MCTYVCTGSVAQAALQWESLSLIGHIWHTYGIHRARAAGENFWTNHVHLPPDRHYTKEQHMIIIDYDILYLNSTSLQYPSVAIGSQITRKESQCVYFATCFAPLGSYLLCMISVGGIQPLAVCSLLLVFYVQAIAWRRCMFVVWRYPILSEIRKYAVFRTYFVSFHGRIHSIVASLRKPPRPRTAFGRPRIWSDPRSVT